MTLLPSIPPPSLILPPSFHFSILSPPFSVSPQGSLSCCFQTAFHIQVLREQMKLKLTTPKKKITINPLQLRWRRCPLGNLYWFRWLQGSDSRGSSIIKLISQQKENGSETILIIGSLFMSYFKQKCQTFWFQLPNSEDLLFVFVLYHTVINHVVNWIFFGLSFSHDWIWTVGLTK